MGETFGFETALLCMKVGGTKWARGIWEHSGFVGIGPNDVSFVMDIDGEKYLCEPSAEDLLADDWREVTPEF